MAADKGRLHRGAHNRQDRQALQQADVDKGRGREEEAAVRDREA